MFSITPIVVFRRRTQNLLCSKCVVNILRRRLYWQKSVKEFYPLLGKRRILLTPRSTVSYYKTLLRLGKRLFRTCNCTLVFFLFIFPIALDNPILAFILYFTSVLIYRPLNLIQYIYILSCTLNPTKRTTPAVKSQFLCYKCTMYFSKIIV